jgi:cyclophilin family peptidyl-prolyl cis-trans isomerase
MSGRHGNRRPGLSHTRRVQRDAARTGRTVHGTNDPNSAGSQFFICLGKATHLDRNYTAFGRTADDASLQVVRAIGDVATGPNDRPRQPVTITKATVTRLQAP